jgi:hypothetical protein
MDGAARSLRPRQARTRPRRSPSPAFPAASPWGRRPRTATRRTESLLGFVRCKARPLAYAWRSVVAATIDVLTSPRVIADRADLKARNNK